MDKNRYPAKAFFSQKMTPEELELSQKHREKFAELAEMLHNDLPRNVYMFDAIDLLETAAMNATKAISHKDYSQDMYDSGG